MEMGSLLVKFCKALENRDNFDDMLRCEQQ